MRSLYLIQQVDLNMLTVILLSGYRVLVAYTLGEDRSQALLRQAKDREGIGLDRPVTPPLLPGITYMATAGQVKPASIA